MIFLSHRVFIRREKYYEGNKGRCKEQTIRGHRKNLSPTWNSNPRPSEDSLASKGRFFVGWTYEPHPQSHSPSQANTLRLNCITQSQ